MLLRNESRLVLSVKVNLFFDDDTERHLTIAEKDIVRIIYNKNGMRDVIEGKVKRIETDHGDKHPCNYRTPEFHEGWRPPHGKRDKIFIIVDGSNVYSGKVARIDVDSIIDAEMIEKFDESLFIKTVSDPDSAVNRFKIFDGALYLSMDNGETYPYAIPLSYPEDIKGDQEEEDGTDPDINPDDIDVSGLEEDTTE